MKEDLIKIARDGKSIGEYSLTDLGLALLDKDVLLSDQYWRPGMKDWEKVQLIAKEAEEAAHQLQIQVRSKFSRRISPKFPQLGPPVLRALGANEMIPISPMSRLHLMLGCFALGWSLYVFYYGKKLGDMLSRLILESQESFSKGANPETFSQGVSEAVGELCNYFLLIPVAFTVSKVTYFIVLGKRREGDNKLINKGDRFFFAAFVIGFCACLYALWQPGVAATVLRASRSS